MPEDRGLPVNRGSRNRVRPWMAEPELPLMALLRVPRASIHCQTSDKRYRANFAAPQNSW
ncbi:MAG: hypothetical protein ACI9NT_000430 [Bacteroidia bacterium]|jgi:hypothetical protein